MQELGVDEQLQRQEEHHQDDAGHQDTVEAGAEQTDLPQGHTASAAGLQPVGPVHGKKHAEESHARALTRGQQGGSRLASSKGISVANQRIRGQRGPVRKTTGASAVSGIPMDTEMKGAAVHDVVGNEIHIYRSETGLFY